MQRARWMMMAGVVCVAGATGWAQDATKKPTEAEVRAMAAMSPEKEWNLAPLVEGKVIWVSTEGKKAYVIGAAVSRSKKASEGMLVDLETGKVSPIFSELQKISPAMKGVDTTNDLMFSGSGKWIATVGGFPGELWLAPSESLKGKKIADKVNRAWWLGETLLVQSSENDTWQSIDPETEKATELSIKGNVWGLDPLGKSFVFGTWVPGKTSHMGVYSPEGKEMYSLGERNSTFGVYSGTGKMLAVRQDIGAGRTTMMEAASGKELWKNDRLYRFDAVTEAGDVIVHEGDPATVYVMGGDFSPRKKVAAGVGPVLMAATGLYTTGPGKESLFLLRYVLGQ